MYSKLRDAGRGGLGEGRGVLARRVDEFFAALYDDADFKARLIGTLFVLLAIPSAIFITLGVSEKPVYLAMLGLVLPISFAFYRLLERRRVAHRVSSQAQPAPEDLRRARARFEMHLSQLRGDLEEMGSLVRFIYDIAFWASIALLELRLLLLGATKIREKSSG